MTGKSPENDEEKKFDSVLRDIQTLVDRTERVINSRKMTLSDLGESSRSFAEIRTLLGNLLAQISRSAPRSLAGPFWSENGPLLAARCMDLEGKIKEQRNDLLRMHAVAEDARSGAGDGVAEMPMTILVVEDDTDVRVVTRSVLSEYGYRVLEAANGSQALDIFVRHQADIQLSLIDIFLPGKNGKEVSDEMRRMRPDAKVLFTSGYSAELLTQQDLARPGTAFIAKPSPPEDLIRKIEGMIRQRITS